MLFDVKGELVAKSQSNWKRMSHPSPAGQNMIELLGKFVSSVPSAQGVTPMSLRELQGSITTSAGRFFAQMGRWCLSRCGSTNVG